VYQVVLIKRRPSGDGPRPLGDKAAGLEAAGVRAVLGAIDAPEPIAAEAARADGVIHLAFNHDFSGDFAAHCEDDRRLVMAMGAALAGSDKRLVVTSGTAMVMSVDGAPATEDGPTMGAEFNPRIASEEAALALAQQGVAACIMRLPQVHDPRRQGLFTWAVAAARAAGEFPYVGDGSARWPGGHVGDVARLYRLAVEQGAPGARYHAVAEEGVTMRDMVTVAAKRLGLPTRSITVEEAQEFYGWIGRFVGHDIPASSAWTRQALGWQPTGPTMLQDVAMLEVD
jgi:nucleoside-diphosphate-sugar epimerase